MRRLLEAHRSPTTATFDAIGAIASEFLDRAAASVPASATPAATECGDGVAAAAGGGALPPLTAECVGELAEMNHRMLCALGVGHPALERVCEIASAHGCKSKLTGAGEWVGRLGSLSRAGGRSPLSSSKQQLAFFCAALRCTTENRTDPPAGPTLT